jgi:hypothetical protein
LHAINAIKYYSFLFSAGNLNLGYRESDWRERDRIGSKHSLGTFHYFSNNVSAKKIILTVHKVTISFYFLKRNLLKYLEHCEGQVSGVSDNPERYGDIAL